MTTTQLLAEHLKSDLGTLKWHLDDFTDADFLVRPCPGANHALWQLGHLVSSTGRMLGQIDGSFASPIAERITAPFRDKELPKSDDPTKFPTPTELRQAVDQLSSAAGAWIASLPDEALDKPSPDWAKDWAPTVGRMLAAMATHVAMHYGQIQVIRRKLGKKHLM